MARKGHKHPAIYFGKFIISGLRFYFHTYIFSFVKAQVFFLDFKTFFTTQIFQNSGFFFNSDFLKKTGFFLKNSDVFKTQIFFRTQVFLKTKLFIVLINAHVIYLLTTIAGSKKMNMMALMIKMVFICFMLHVPLDGNY